MLGHCDPKHFHIYLSVNALLFNSPEVLQHTGESNMRPQARRSRPRHHSRSEMFNSQATGGSRWQQVVAVAAATGSADLRSVLL